MATKKRSPVKKRTPAKKVTAAKAPAKKATTKKKAAKKTTTKKKATKKAPAKKTSPANGKKKPPMKDPPEVKLFDGEIEFRVGDDLKERLRWAHQMLDKKDEHETITAVFDAGLGILEDTLKPEASGNLVDLDDDDDEEEYDGEFEEGWHDHIEGRI